MPLKKWAKRFGSAVLMLALAVAGLWTVSRLMGPTDAQEAALARMRDIPPLNGRNAFPALWLVAYDMPEAEHDDWLAEDLRRHAAGQPPGGAYDAAEKAHASAAERRYADRMPSPDEFDLFCGSAPGCLDRVGADRGRYADLLRRHAALLDRVEALSAYAGIRHAGGENILGTLIPPYQAAKLPATRHALDFVEGRRDRAFDGTCRAIATWRRLGADSDSLISRIIGVAYAADLYGGLFVDMLARTPRDVALPASCAQAFSAPADGELSLCMAMQGELKFMQSAVRMADANVSTSERLTMLFGLSADMTEAERAEQLAFHCSAEAQRAIAADTRIERNVPEPGFLRFECVGNPVGCMLANIAHGSLDGYGDRIQDGNAKLRLIAELLRMRADGTPPEQVAVRLRTVQDRVGSRLRALSLGEDGRTLRMRNYETSRGEFTEIPLPPYLQSASSGSVPSKAAASKPVSP
ncbi:hypothetical protein [Lysobacter hankyongensis]|uniref:Uncharacterized protein n=1 Tax=Lysobacter hankyongensis TaxID=1176535 RepID=A0ABP9BVL8_9GAMM